MPEITGQGHKHCYIGGVSRFYIPLTKSMKHIIPGACSQCKENSHVGGISLISTPLMKENSYVDGISVFPLLLMKRIEQRCTTPERTSQCKENSLMDAIFLFDLRVMKMGKRWSSFG